MATGRTRIEALRMFEQRTSENTLEQPRRWVVYVALGDDLLARFAEAVTRAGQLWRPLVINPGKLDDVLKNLHPDAVVVAIPEPQPETLTSRTMALDGTQRIVLDDADFSVVSRLCRSAS